MFRTSQGQARYFAAYDATLALWPGPVESFDVQTRCGPTHIHACGSKDAPPLVLLHGAAISSTMWYPNIAALSQTYCVYAPDTVGEMGKSVSTRPMKKPSDFVEWLSDVFDGLQLKQAHVVGLSAGGFIAFQFAFSAPDRVKKLILLSPAGLLPFWPLFYLRMAAAIFVPFLSPRSRQMLLLGVFSPVIAPAIKQMLTPNDFRYQMFLPPAFTDEQLRQIKAPTLLLLGEHEVIYNPQTALVRAQRLIPQLEAESILQAGHALNFDQPEIVNRRILEFLNKEA